jgi:hypothetical protein
MTLIRLLLPAVLLLTTTTLKSQAKPPWEKVAYVVDKNIEIEQNKFEFIDTGVLKKALNIRVYWDDKIFFNNYGEGRALDCFTRYDIAGDTINVTAYMAGVLGYGFTLTIFGDSCVVFPFAISDGDIYQANPNEKPYTNLVLLATTSHRVRLLQKPLFKDGETVAGHVQLKSIPYYYKGLKGKFIIEVNAYFKTAPLKFTE